MTSNLEVTARKTVDDGRVALDAAYSAIAIPEIAASEARSGLKRF